MISNAEKISFTAVGNGGTVAEIDVSDAFQASVIIDLDSGGGAFGTATFYVVPMDDQVLGRISATDVDEHIRKSKAAGAVGTFICGFRGTAIAEPAFEVAYRKVRVIVELVTLTSVTGSVYVTKKRF